MINYYSDLTNEQRQKMFKSHSNINFRNCDSECNGLFDTLKTIKEDERLIFFRKTNMYGKLCD